MLALSKLGNRRRHRVTVQEQTGTTRGSYGELTESWTGRFSAGALVENLSGREVEWARQLAPTATVRVTLPWPRPTDPTTEMRIKIEKNGRILQIEHVDNVEEADRVAVLLCSEDAS